MRKVKCIKYVKKKIVQYLGETEAIIQLTKLDKVV